MSKAPAFSLRGALLLRPFDESADVPLSSLQGPRYMALASGIVATLVLALCLLGAVVVESPYWTLIALVYAMASALLAMLELNSKMPGRAVNTMMPSVLMFAVVVLFQN